MNPFKKMLNGLLFLAMTVWSFSASANLSPYRGDVDDVIIANGSGGGAVTLTVDLCDANPTEVRMTGFFWGWDPVGGPVASDNGDGTWSVVLDPAPTADMEYIWLADGVQENLLDNDPLDLSCTPVTDGANYANRLWTVGSGDVTGDVYDSCTACAGGGGGGAVTLTVDLCDANPTEVRMTGFFWGWDPVGGPVATDNGDGTWSVVLDPAPTADMEYLWLADGVQENLLDNSPQDLSCTPVTDGANFANRLWTVGSGDVTGDVYDSCVACDGTGGGGGPVTLTVDLCGASANEVRMTGFFWGWDPVGGPVASDNGDGTWSVTLDPAPTADMEYLWLVDGVQENLLDNSPQNLSCTPVTDGANFANRLWTVGSGDVTGDVYDSCLNCDGTGGATPLTLTVDLCDANPTEVRMTGFFWGWDPNGGPVASDNGDGTWSVVLDPAPTADMEYIWLADGVQENLLDNDPLDLSCTPVTDGANYANRLWTVGSPDVTGDVYDSCTACAGGGGGGAVTLTVDLCDANPTEVRMTGFFWGWDPVGGPVASDNGDGTWSVVLDPAPTENMEYIWLADGVQENLLDNDPLDLSCTPVTDGANYANRLWTVGSGDVTGDVYDKCTACDGTGGGGGPVTLTVDLCDATPTEVRMTGFFWGWDPVGGPVASDNGDGTWSVVLDPAPTENMEYLWVVDGVQENLLDNVPQDLSCTPVTDGANFANRIWPVGSGDVTGDVYDSCTACAGGDVDGCTDANAANYDPAATNDDGSCAYNVDFEVDMNEYGAAFGFVNVSATWNEFCGDCNQLTDDDMDGIYTGTIPVPTGFHQYLFTLDNFAVAEALTPGTSCTVTIGGFTNRSLTVGTSAVVTDQVCWESCNACVGGGTPGCNDVTANNYDPAATANDGSCLYNVTFSVDMSDYTGPAFTTMELNGNFNGWCGTCAPMTDLGNGIWELTVELQDGTYEYKFTFDNFAGQEEFTAGDICTVSNFGFTNRYIQVTGNQSTPVYCYNSCSECPGEGDVPGCTDANANNYDPAANLDDGSCLYNVSLSVDMSQYAPAFTTVYISGAFNGWDGGANPMDDSNMDNIWEVTVEMPAGDQQYKFQVDQWVDQEEFVGGESCTITDDGFTNRVVNVSGATNVPLVCWNSCSTCPAAFYTVTFRVDMANEMVAPEGVYITGTFNGFDPAASQMTYLGYGIYEFSVLLGEGSTVEYKYLNGNTFAGEEIVPMECGVDNGFGGYNRAHTVGGMDEVLPVVCFSACEACAGCTDPFSLEFNPFAGADDGSCATPIVPGCTYADADNYNPSANDDDGSCTFTIGGGDCPSDLNGDQLVNAADLLEFLSAFGTTCL